MKSQACILLIVCISTFTRAQIYDESIDSLMQQTNLDSLITYVRILSGEDSVTLDDSTVLIQHRVSIYDNDLAADYLRQKLESFGLTPYDQLFGEHGRNVIAVQTGTTFPEKKFIICAHYDAVTDYCADDNASGSAAVLEAARILSKYPIPCTIIYAFWDAEEMGSVGSAWYAAKADSINENILGVLNLEMFGWDSDDDGLIDIHTRDIANSTSLAVMVENIISIYELGLIPYTFNPGTTASDHASFWDYGLSAIVFSQAFFNDDRNPFYHSAQDRIDKFNLPYFLKLSKLAVGSIATLVYQKILSAYFTAVQLTGHAPLEIHFDDKSYGEIESWQWDFDNDGTIDSYDQNPIWVYQNPGNYSIQLQVIDQSSIHSFSRENYIHVFNGESALNFEEEDYAYVPAVPSLNLSDNFTIEMLVNPQEWIDGQDGITILDKSAIKLFITGYAFGYLGDSSLAVNLHMNDGTQIKMSTPDKSIMLSEWQHIAVSYQSALHSFKMYINGIQKDVTVIGSVQPSSKLMDNDTIPIYIGNNLTREHGFYGALDEFRLWNVVRTDSEIEDNMDNQLNGDENGLIGYWQMNEGSGNILVDNSPSGNKGNIVSGEYIQGVDISTLTQNDINSAAESKPTDFVLYQNYPNPFNPITYINYSIPVAVHVNISVYNVIGQHLINLINEKMPAGSHQVTFAPQSLSSGIYYYRIEAGEFHNVKKMIYIK